LIEVDRKRPAVAQSDAISGLWAQGPFYGVVVEKAEHRMMEEL